MFSYSRRICKGNFIWVDWIVVFEKLLCLFDNPEEQSNTGSTNGMSLGGAVWPMTDRKNLWETCLKTVISLVKLVAHRLDASP